MRIVIHDFTAFSFPAQLSRELARRGFDVLHLYSDMDPRGGRLSREPDDPSTLAIEPITIGETYAKYRVVGRARQEWKYGDAVAKRLRAYRPDVVINANTAVSISHRIRATARRLGARYVHWTQDIYSLAAEAVLTKRHGTTGWVLAKILHRMEAFTLNRADAVIMISDDFKAEFERLGIRPKRSYTIPNWMPTEEMRPESKVNPWSLRHGLAGTINVMYVGTLGLKHDTGLFLALAERFATSPRVRVVVVGAGLLFDQLMTEREARGLSNLVLLGWQDYRDIAYVLATADVLVAMVSRDASRFSVPSKILSYLCADRPVVAAIPSDNLARRLLEDNGMGLAADPDDTEAVLELTSRLIDSETMRASVAARGRAYAEEHFDIEAIGGRFAAIIDDVTGR